MDLTSLIGIVVGFALIIFVGIGPSKIMNFWDPASVAIVLGGTLAAIVASYPRRILKETGKHMKILFQGKRYNIPALIDVLVDMAQTARKSGLLSLEEKANEQEDMFFKQGIMLIVDATEPEEVREMMENELDAMSERHEQSLSIYEKGANYAPAFGMIGTLVGLVNMLMEMNLDDGGSSNIGYNMGVALITTFYGCIMAHLIFSPIARKLRIRNEEELLYKQIMIEGILAIQAGDNPKFLREKLLSYLCEEERIKITENGEEGKKAKKSRRVKNR